MSLIRSVKLVHKISSGSRQNIATVAKRPMSTARECEDDTQLLNKCTTETISATPCQVYTKKPKSTKNSQPQYSYINKSMWETVPCCNTCSEDMQPVRHDVLYLNQTDYRDRRYQRTWPECQRECRVKKCKSVELNLPPMEKRPRGQGNPNAKWCAKLHECAKIDKFVMPCGPGVCKKKACVGYAKSSCCQKRCTLYPSYSECCKNDPKLIRPNECSCLRFQGLCQVNDYLRRMGISNGKK